MTRDEFMKEAEKEIDQVLLTHRNRLMNLVMKAWAEGKKNAEIDAMTKMAREMLDRIYPNNPAEPEEPATRPSIVEIEEPPVPDIPGGYWNIGGDVVPEACRHCKNHPSNGGSGNCNCILGSPKVTC